MLDRVAGAPGDSRVGDGGDLCDAALGRYPDRVKLVPRGVLTEQVLPAEHTRTQTVLHGGMWCHRQLHTFTCGWSQAQFA